MTDTGSSTEGRLTTKGHWDEAHGAPIRMRLPSRLLSSTRDVQRLLRPWVRPGARVLEIGFAPGKHLAWVTAALGASVAGLDFSEPGVRTAERLFAALGLTGDLRCEDVFATSFALGSFDLVYSLGVIEHFDDPRPIVRRHFELLRPGGRTIITIPNLGGIYGRLQGRLAPDNLAIHNLSIMRPDRLARLAPRELAASVVTRTAGRVSVEFLRTERVLGRRLAKAALCAVNGLALLQPWDIPAVAPWLVLEGERQR
jgi:2-polyprenyl-3-methyl-5-hydroxy-6-metoxy-1,4-benzoquinol methylase